ncbi:SIR2 family NAD-dependent protein deacylase [Pseudoramibacter alactolyticus]|uniref:SIR2 family NAD-dependent protein deacylase n=1 Tax=Pseudoramibacter alactolyticus TaxID=113287 RepID=UPI00248EB383|nr:hypothetical protein [Pseudoramibacter alactolyticus]
MFSKNTISKSTGNCSDKIKKFKAVLDAADAVVIGAGSGLSTAAGFNYFGERFHKYFQDFIDKYGIRDMYSGGFYPFPSAEIQWAWWSRHIWLNRYVKAPKPVYSELLDRVKDMDYFVLTTNVDHQFQQAGFNKKRLFYTQGDYGLFQCSKPCHNETYDNKEIVRDMIEAQGFVIEGDDSLTIPVGAEIAMEVPEKLVSRCPVCKEEMTVNLRCDDSFVEDEGWHRAADCYSEFIRRHKNSNIVYLELGVGMNTPVIIKYPFWQYTAQNLKAYYVCLNLNEAYVPDEIADRSISIDGDILDVIKKL